MHILCAYTDQKLAQQGQKNSKSVLSALPTFRNSGLARVKLAIIMIWPCHDDGDDHDDDDLTLSLGRSCLWGGIQDRSLQSQPRWNPAIVIMTIMPGGINNDPSKHVYNLTWHDTHLPIGVDISRTRTGYRLGWFVGRILAMDKAHHKEAGGKSKHSEDIQVNNDYIAQLSAQGAPYIRQCTLL